MLSIAVLLGACQPDDRAASIESSDIEKSICSRFATLSAVPPRSSVLDQRILDGIADLLEIDLAIAKQAGDDDLAARIEGLIDASRKGPANEVGVSVYLKEDISEDEVERISALIEDATGVFSIEYVTSSEAYEEYKGIYEDQPEFFEDVAEDSIPASLRFEVDDLDETMESLESQLVRNRNVDDIRHGAGLERLAPVLTREMERCLVGLFD